MLEPPEEKTILDKENDVSERSSEYESIVELPVRSTKKVNFGSKK